MNLNFSKYYRLENHSCWSFMVLFWFSSRVTQIRVQLWSGGWEGLSKAVSLLHKLDWVPPRRWSIKSYLNSLSYIAVFGQEGHILAWGAVTPVTAGSVHRKKRSLNDGGGHESVFWKLMIFPPCFQAGWETPPLVCWVFFALGSCTTICIQFYLIKMLHHLTCLGRKIACSRFGLIVFASRSHLMAVISVTKLHVHPYVFACVYNIHR